MDTPDPWDRVEEERGWESTGSDTRETKEKERRRRRGGERERPTAMRIVIKGGIWKNTEVREGAERERDVEKGGGG